MRLISRYAPFVLHMLRNTPTSTKLASCGVGTDAEKVHAAGERRSISGRFPPKIGTGQTQGEDRTRERPTENSSGAEHHEHGGGLVPNPCEEEEASVRTFSKCDAQEVIGPEQRTTHWRFITTMVARMYSDKDCISTSGDENALHQRGWPAPWDCRSPNHDINKSTKGRTNESQFLVRNLK